MEKLTFEYPAIKIKQNDFCNDLILFGASAFEMRKWAGVPQKKKLDDVETVGFQRVENKKRLSELRSFYLNEKNIIQNTLICAIRDIEGCSTTFQEIEGNGSLKVEFPNFYNMEIVELFGILRSSLEKRIKDKSLIVIDDQEKQRLKELLSVVHNSYQFNSVESEAEDSEYDDEEANNSSNEVTSIVTDDSHLTDFIKEIAIRHEILKECPQLFSDADDFLGFTRQSLISFILPVSLVDGQHRLLGAVDEINHKMESGKFNEQLFKLIDDGYTAEEANEKILKMHTRVLPISLLMSTDPSEQVFQFVVINQKATPIERSLLGTIVSTTLTSDEMEGVTKRLTASGIKLEEARAITWAARDPASPFYQLVDRGVNNDASELLQWSVTGKIINIFKELDGGVLFGERNDYAKRWKDKFLAESELVSNFDEELFPSAYEYWSSLEGPWRTVFIAFWNKIKSKFSQSTNKDRRNYWGSPRESNLFNKISLTILAADFFQFLIETKTTVNSAYHVSDLVDAWLEDTDPAYFDKEWNLSGVKKDSKGIRDRWAELWKEYRKNPERLPKSTMYRNPKKSG